MMRQPPALGCSLRILLSVYSSTGSVGSDIRLSCFEFDLAHQSPLILLLLGRIGYDDQCCTTSEGVSGINNVCGYLHEILP